MARRGPVDKDDVVGLSGEDVFQHRIRLLGGILDSWVQENQGKLPEDHYQTIYSDYLKRIYQSYHNENKEQVGKILSNIKKTQSGEQKFFNREDKEVQSVLNNLKNMDYKEDEIMWLINQLEKYYQL